MSTNAEQLILAAQGSSSVAQQLQMTTTDADVDLDVHITFLDQNNA